MHLVVIALSILVSASTSSSKLSVIANVRGKKVNITASTVEEVLSQVQRLYPVKSHGQSVLFRGKVLQSADSLHDTGIVSGDVLNVIKGRKTKIPHALPTLNKEKLSYSDVKPIRDIFEKEENDWSRIQQEFKNLDPEKLKKAVSSLETMLDSAELDAFFNDDIKVEAARLELLKNLTQFESLPGAPPGLRAMAEDPALWKDSMARAAAELAEARKLKMVPSGSSSITDGHASVSSSNSKDEQ